MFFGEDVFKQTKLLSGGEKKKLALARLLALPANFLILGEPTNHLDINSLESLQQSLCEYDGTLLFISHDRHFLTRVPQRILALRDGGLIDFDGNYAEFVASQEPAEKEAPSQAELEKRRTYREEKREKNIKSARRKRIKELEELIGKQEQLIRDLDEQLVDPANASDWEKLARLEADKKAAVARLDEMVAECYQLIEEDEAAGS
jgi:ATP-binding cassette subfamily F protein 3